MNQNTTTDGAEITALEKDLIHTVYPNKCLLNAHHLERIRKVYSEIHGSEDLSELKLIVEFKGEIDISRDISESYLSTRVRPKICEALVSNDPRTFEYLRGAGALMAKHHPVQAFMSFDEAKKWVDSF